MSVLKKSLMLAASAGLVLLAFSSDTSSAGQAAVKANISFVRVISLHKESDVTFGGLQTRPNDKVTMGPDGNMRLLGKGEVLTPFGSPSIITIGNDPDHILNIVPGNYLPGQGISSLQAHCVVKGGRNGDCEGLPISGSHDSTLFIGMDMTLSDKATPVDNDKPPSFDMSVVYQ